MLSSELHRSTSKQKAPKASLPSLLRAELARRCRENPAYSLRAFAKSLGFSPAFVSKLLNGQRRFTEATVARLRDRLALDPATLAQYSTRAGKRAATVEDAESPEFRRIELDQFQAIADWHHFAILELTTVKGFDGSPRFVASRLGIHLHQATDALDRLVRLGYLARDRRGRLRLVEENSTTVGRNVAHAAGRQQQTQFLALASLALQETPIEQRSQSGMTMAIPADRLPEATAAITEFRRKLTALLQRPGARDSVYQLSISFFPLTKP